MLSNSPIALANGQCHNWGSRSNYWETKPLPSVSNKESGQSVRRVLDAVPGKRSISREAAVAGSECRVTRGCLPKAG